MEEQNVQGFLKPLCEGNRDKRVPQDISINAPFLMRKFIERMIPHEYLENPASFILLPTLDGTQGAWNGGNRIIHKYETDPKQVLATS